MKFLKKFTNENDRDTFIENAQHYPIVTLVMPESGDTSSTNYYGKDDLNIPRYTVNLNNQWQLSSVTNPDPNTYEGVYESFSNKGINNSGATMTITISGYSEFTLYIRSYAESNYDYVMVSQLDQTINNNTSYSDTALVKKHTRGIQKSDPAISSYIEVKYENIDRAEHTITIVYRKDTSTNSGNDCGYVLIKK